MTINETEFKKHRIIDVDAGEGDLYNDDSALSSEGDWLTGHQGKSLEDYDKEMDEMLVEAKNISEVYKALTESTISKMKDRLDKVSSISEHFQNFDTSLLNNATLAELSPEDFMRSRNVFLSDEEIAKDPEKLRNMAKFRIQYCNAMVKMFQNMLKLNNKALGLSAEEAAVIAKAVGGDSKQRKMGIQQVKAAVLKNEGKFKTRYGFDFTSLGGGQVITSGESLGAISRAFTVERMLQFAMDNDLTVLSHGGAAAKGQEAKLEKILELNDDVTEYLQGLSTRDTTKVNTWIGKVNTLINLINDTELTADQKAKLKSSFKNKLLPKINKLIDDLNKIEGGDANNPPPDILRKAVEIEKQASKVQWSGDENEERTWTMQRVGSPWGGSYINVVKLCEDAIKHGYKKIKLLNCNPGRVDISKIKSLQNKPGVVISFSARSMLVAENVESLDYYEQDSLNEGVKELWSKFKAFVKKAWEKIKAAFMKMINWVKKFARMIKGKIKGFFDKFRGKKTEEKTRHIYLNPSNGNVTDKETTNSEQACNEQAKNIEDTATILERITKIQDIAFKQYMELIDKLAEEGDHVMDDNAYMCLAAVMEAACGMNTLTGGIVVTDEKISDDYLKDYPSLADF